MNKFKMAGLFIALTFFQVLMVVQSNLVLADDIGEVKFLVNSFFEYLETGDTEGIISSLADPLVSDYGRTLGNPNYAYKLMQAYGGAEVVVKKTEIINRCTVRTFVEIRNEDGVVSETSFLIKKINDRWKIADEINIKMVVQSNLALADDIEELESLFIDFFEYLKTGDTEAIVFSLADPILSNHRRSLRNPNYPYQLIQAYGGAEVVVERTKIINDYAVQIFVKIRHEEGTVSKTSFLIKKINNRWKLADEININ